MVRRKSKRKRAISRLQMENLESRELLAGDLMQNPVEAADVNNDGLVAPIDAMIVINSISDQARGLEIDSRPDASGRPTRFMDVNNDGSATPIDALRVLNWINEIRRGEGRPPTGTDAGNADQAPPPNAQARPPADAPGGNNGGQGVVQAQTDFVLDWNNLFNEILVSDVSKQNPGYASRAMAMLNVAIYDAVAIAADGDDANAFYDYGDEINTNANISAETAASQAAYTVLSSLYSDQQGTLDAFVDDRIGRNNGNTAASVALGTTIGNEIISARADDGWDTVVDFEYTDELGSFQADPLNPEVPVWGPAWGEVDTFAISSIEGYTPETTPPLTSAEYAASYNEVKELGSVDSAVRTADQTEAGIFWAYDRAGLGTPLSLFNDVLTTIAVQEGNTMEENAALFAQASVAMADSAIVAWNTKFGEEFWRPVTAIHDGDIDGNPLTKGDADWTALGAPDGGDDIIGFTPQFPTYISGHATFGGALFGSLQEFYGTDDIAFDLSSNELEILLDNPELQEAYGLNLDDATRSFDSLSEAMAENGRSRVYLGIHFDFDDLVGQEVGQSVAATVSSEFVVASNDVNGPGGGPGGRPDPRPGNGGRPGGNDNGGPRGAAATVASVDISDIDPAEEDDAKRLAAIDSIFADDLI